MLKVFPGPSYTTGIIGCFQKQNDYYLIPLTQITSLQQLIDQIFYQNFGHNKNQVVNFIQLIIKKILNLQFSIPSLNSLLEAIKKQEKSIQQFKEYFLNCQSILLNDFEQITQQKQQQNLSQNPIISKFDQHDLSQRKSLKQDNYLSETCQFGSPNVSQQEKVDCDFWNTCDRFLEIDSYKNQYLNRSSLSQKKAKLKIQGLVSSFNFDFFKHKLKNQGDLQIKNWQKKIKKSILNQKNLQNAAIDYIPCLHAQKYQKQIHYRNKVKNTKLKNKLSKNIL